MIWFILLTVTLHRYFADSPGLQAVALERENLNPVNGYVAKNIDDAFDLVNVTLNLAGGEKLEWPWGEGLSGKYFGLTLCFGKHEGRLK